MLKEYIKTSRNILEKRTHTFFEERKKTIPVGLTTLRDSLNFLQRAIPRGKLLRGIQIMLAYEMFGGKNQEESVHAALALEITHAGVLMQDDFMDNDYTRRGERSVFAQYIDSGKNNHAHDPLLYGQSMATCVGDISFFITNELLSSCSHDPIVNQKVVGLFSQEWQLVGAGQMLDVDFASRPYEPTEEEVMSVYRYKTARYSFSLPLSMGALLAHADEKIIKKLDEFGENLGLIFQIKDDELGLFGDEKTIGKPIGSDIRENKKTLFRALLMQKIPAKERTSLSAIFGNKNIEIKDIQYVQNLMKQYNVTLEIQEKIKTLSQKVFQLLDSMAIEKPYKDLLSELVQLNLKRDK